MSTNIYQEAIAEAKKLRDIAEQNATNKIVEAIAPRIRRLIEQELGDELDADIEDDEMDVSDFGADSPQELAQATDSVDPALGMDDKIPAPSDNISLDPSVSGDVSVDSMDDEFEDDEENEKEVTVNITVENSRKSKVILQTVRVKSLVRQLRETKNPRKRTKILKQLNGLSKTLIISGNLLEQKLGKQISNILKESNMSGRKRRPTNRRLRENAWWMFEGDEVEDLDLDLEDEGAEAEEGGDIDVAAVESAVEDLAGALGMEVAPAEEGGAEEAEAEGKEGGDEELDLDLEEWQMYEADDEEDIDAGHMRANEAEHEENEDEADLGEVYISEAALRRELSRMRRSSRRNRAPSRRNRRRMNESEAVDAANLFPNDVHRELKNELSYILYNSLGYGYTVGHFQFVLCPLEVGLLKINLYDAPLFWRVRHDVFLGQLLRLPKLEHREIMTAT